MKKIRVALLSLILTSFVLAEENGWFVGAQAGYGVSKTSWESTTTIFNTNIKQTQTETYPNHKGFRYGVLFGYKHFIGPVFGLRYYALYDNGSAYTNDSTLDVKTQNFNVNVDALFNFISQNDFDFGIFAGFYLGGAWNELKAKDGIELSHNHIDSATAGANLGLRANIAKNHGLELYSRFSLIDTTEEETITRGGGERKTQYKNKEPWQVGLRYTFSF